MRFLAATAKIKAKLGGQSPEIGRKEGMFLFYRDHCNETRALMDGCTLSCCLEVSTLAEISAVVLTLHSDK